MQYIWCSNHLRGARARSLTKPLSSAYDQANAALNLSLSTALPTASVVAFSFCLSALVYTFPVTLLPLNVCWTGTTFVCLLSACLETNSHIITIECVLDSRIHTIIFAAFLVTQIKLRI
jgi:hypothetical protein